ncbi:MAG: helix-turn-helix transcriptional regulator [Oscillospiraceae bacterium]|nr:helix-turn-helix transcriptional regulator [Oscillospiraceae bacterium]
MNKEALGKFIAENRKALGMTQEELANKLFVTNKAVSKWEKGQSFPDIALFEPLAEALGVSVAELIACEKEAENDVSIKEVLEVSHEIIKKHKRNLQKALAALLFALLALLIVFSGNIRNAIDERNMEYLYWKGYYYIPFYSASFPGKRLSEPIGTVIEAGIKNDDNYGGDSNCADPGTDIYYILPPEDGSFYEYENVLIAEVDGRLTLFRAIYYGRQDFERYNQVNVKEGAWGKGYFTSEDYY